MTESEAEEMRKRDSVILNARKKTFETARFAHIEKTNQKYGQPKEVISPKPLDSSSVNHNDSGNDKDNKQEKNKRRGWNFFSKKNNNNTDVTPNTDTASTTKTALTTSAIKNPPPIAARSVKPINVRQVVLPGWASVDKKNERTIPEVHSSKLAASTKTISSANKKSQNSSPNPKLPIFKTVEYGTTSLSGNKHNGTVSTTITSLQGSYNKKIIGNPKQTRQSKVNSSTSESIDAYGNITRTITRKITDGTGKTTTETEIIEIPKAKK